MKNLVVVALVFFTLTGFAQKKHKQKHNCKEMVQQREDISAEDMASLQSKKMTLHLDLNAAQQEKVYAILLEQAKDKKAHKAKHLAKKAENNKPTKAEFLKNKHQKLDKQIAMKRKMKSILTANQYEKFEKMKPKKGRKKKMRYKKQ